jgi:hypothetical protein
MPECSSLVIGKRRHEAKHLFQTPHASRAQLSKLLESCCALSCRALIVLKQLNIAAVCNFEFAGTHGRCEVQV